MPFCLSPSRNAPLRKKYSAIIGRHYREIERRKRVGEEFRRRYISTSFLDTLQIFDPGSRPPAEKRGDGGIKGREINASISSRTRWNTLRHFGAARVPRTFFLYRWKKLPFEPPPLIRAKPKSVLPRLGRNFSSYVLYFADLCSAWEIRSYFKSFSLDRLIDRWMDSSCCRPDGRFLSIPEWI